MADNPESLKEVNALKITSEVSSFVKELSTDITEERTQRGEWEQRLDEYFRKRYGIRNKKTFPWPGAANFVIPVIDADITRLKPSYVNLYAAVSPAVTFEPYGAEDVEPARKREMLFDWRMKTQVNFFPQYCIGIDKMLEKGFIVFKIFWRFETRTYTKFLDLEEMDDQALGVLYDVNTSDEMLFQIISEEFRPDLSFEENIKAIEKGIKDFRAGKSKIEFEFVEKSHDHAEVVACDPKEDIVIPVDTTDIQEARFIDYKYYTTKNKLKIDMKSGKFQNYDDDRIEAWKVNSQNVTKYTKGIRDGISNYGQNELILMHETCCWYDINNDGIEEKCITTWPDADPESVLRFIENPYDHGLFPYEQVKREWVDPSFYSSRGIPALDDDFQVGISTKFNQDVDNQTIVNTPTIVARRNSVKNLRNLRYVPGQVIETDNGPSDFEIRQNANASQGTFLMTANYLKSWANERLGNLTSGLSTPNNMLGAGEGGRKTAKEIQAVEYLSSQTQSLDLLVFQYQMQRVYFQIDALYDQFGPDEEEILTTGDKPMKISRREIQGKFNMVPNGRLDNSNPQMRAAKSFNLMRMFANDPDVKQYELKKMYLDDTDIRLSKRLLYSEQEIAERGQIMAQQQEAMKGKAIQEQVQLKRISNAVDLEKEQALSTIQGKKYAPE